MTEKLFELIKTTIIMCSLVIISLSFCIFSGFSPHVIEAAPYYLGAISNLDPDMDGLIAVNIGGTGAGTATGARSNLGAASTDHDSTHFSGSTPGSDYLTCNEGEMAQGNGDDKLVCSPTIPNAVFSLPTSDDAWTGIGMTATAGATITQWQVVFYDTDGANNKWELADANVSGDFPAWGLATAGVSADESLVVIVRGCIRNDGWNGTYTHGDLLYLDETTAGGLVASASAPDTTGDCVQPIGVFLDLGSDCYLCVNVDPVAGWGTVP